MPDTIILYQTGYKSILRTNNNFENFDGSYRYFLLCLYNMVVKFMRVVY